MERVRRDRAIAQCPASPPPSSTREAEAAEHCFAAPPYPFATPSYVPPVRESAACLYETRDPRPASQPRLGIPGRRRADPVGRRLRARRPSGTSDSRSPCRYRGATRRLDPFRSPRSAGSRRGATRWQSHANRHATSRHPTRSDPTSRRTVAATVDALDRGLHSLPRRPADPATLHALDIVYRDPRFHPPCTLLQCLGNLIGGLLRPLHLTFGIPLPGLPPIPLWLLAIVFLLLLAAAVLWLIRGSLARTAADILPGEPRAGPRIAATYAEAAARANAGDYRAALHFLFLATLLELHERAGTSLRPGLTNRELLDAATSLDAAFLATPPRRTAMRDLVDEFDRVWYGHFPFDAAGYARCLALSRQLVGREAAA